MREALNTYIGDLGSTSGTASLPLLGLPAIRELHTKRALLTQADILCLNRCLAARLERFAAEATNLQVARALFSQSATPRTLMQALRSLLLSLFILWGLLVFGKTRFVELLFDNSPSDERAQFVMDLLGGTVFSQAAG